MGQERLTEMLDRPKGNWHNNITQVILSVNSRVTSANLLKVLLVKI